MGFGEANTVKSGRPAPEGRCCTRCGGKADLMWGDGAYCKRHYRLVRMRYSARHYGKHVPSLEALEAMVEASDGLKCGDCRRQMVWLRAEDGASCVTLQHYRDGTCGLVCNSCNSRHAAMPGDTYRTLPPGHKWCPSCEILKPLGQFYPERGYVSSHCCLCRLWRQQRRTSPVENPRTYGKAERLWLPGVVRRMASERAEVIAAEHGVSTSCLYRAVHAYLDSIVAARDGVAKLEERRAS